MAFRSSSAMVVPPRSAPRAFSAASSAVSRSSRHSLDRLEDGPVLTYAMKRSTLRRRLNTVLFQWFLLLAVAAGTVLAFSFPGTRRNLVDDRLLLARTIAHSLDGTLSAALQALGRLSAELPALPADVAGRLRIFRFQSPFREATYVLDDRAKLIVSDPADAGGGAGRQRGGDGGGAGGGGEGGGG